MYGNDPLRIGLIRWKSFPSDLHTRRVAKFLANRGHDVHVICQNEGAQPIKENIDGVSVHRIPPKNESALRQFVYHVTHLDFVWYHYLKKFIAEQDFDILHVMDLYPLPTVHHSTPTKLPIIADLRELYLESLESYKKNMRLYQQLLRPNWRYERMEKKSINRADGFMTESSAATEHYIDKYEINPEYITEVRCVPDIERLQKIATNVEPQSYPDEFVITFAGNFTPQRDLNTLIRAFATLDDASLPVRLLMIGDGPVLNELVNLVNDLGISDKVEFTGWVSFERMFDYLAGSDVGVCLCLPENKDSKTAKPNKLFQYMFMGLPVIVGDLPAMRETVAKTKSGLIVEPANVDDLAGTIQRLYDDTELAHDLGQQGRQSVLEDLHFPKEGESILDLYRNVIE